MNENYVQGLVDAALILNENINLEINARASVHYDVINQNYDINIFYDWGWDNFKNEEASDVLAFSVSEKSITFKKRETLWEIYLKLEGLEKIFYRDDYHSNKENDDLNSERE